MLSLSSRTGIARVAPSLVTIVKEEPGYLAKEVKCNSVAWLKSIVLAVDESEASVVAKLVTVVKDLKSITPMFASYWSFN